MLRACMENKVGPPGSWTEEQVIEGERERERDSRTYGQRKAQGHGPSTHETQVEPETEQRTRIHIYIRINTEYASGYNRSGRRNRCRCLFVFALRGYDGGTAGSTRAFLEAARASRKPAERKVMENGQRRSVRFRSDSTSSSLMRAPLSPRLPFFYSSRREPFTSLTIYLPNITT